MDMVSERLNYLYFIKWIIDNLEHKLAFISTLQIKLCIWLNLARAKVGLGLVEVQFMSSYRALQNRRLHNLSE